MLTALILATISQVPATGEAWSRVPRVERIQRAGGRVAAGPALPFFSAFTASGAGTFGACSTTPPTGAKGEALTFTRASTATCTKTASGGLATTGIADGDLVLMASGQPRMEYQSDGVLGLRVESQGINLLLSYDDLTNLAWSDVGTPTVTDGATDPFGGTTGDTIEDNDGAAFEGRTQTITVSAGAAYFGYCYVKAGTATTARITLDGTAATISGLSPTTWSIVEVADASSSGVAIVVQVLVGNATTVTGTVVWGGCDVKAGTYRTSIVPTAGTSATRAGERPVFALAGPASTASMSSVTEFGHGATKNSTRTLLSLRLVADAASAMGSSVLANLLTHRCTLGALQTAESVGAFGATPFTSACLWGGADMTECLDSTCASTMLAATLVSGDVLGIGVNATASGNLQVDGIVSRICLDTNPTKCR